MATEVVKRYDAIATIDNTVEFDVYTDGSWVKYSDYEELWKHLQAAHQQIEALKRRQIGNGPFR